MNNTAKGLIASVATLFIILGAFVYGKRSGQQAPPPPQAASEQPAMPAGHPPADGLPAREGVASAPESLHFVHFRVGQRNVKAIVPDGEVVWVGTSGGLIRYDTASDKYRLFDLRSGLLANGIFYIGYLKGRLSVGTYGGGLSLMREDGETWDTYNVPHGLADAFIYDALETDDGDIWIATWSGANLVRGGALDDPGAWETYTVANTDGGLPNDWVYALDKGADGTIWFATEGGLARMKDGVWTSWNHEDGQGADYELVKDQLQFKNDPANYSEHHKRQKEEMGLQDVNVAYNPNYIVALHVDPDNTVWAGTWGGGLARFKDGEWTNFTVNDGLPANHIFSLHRDPAGVLWVGTSAGIARFQPGPVRTYTTADGLFSDQVFAIATTDDGQHWVGSFGGVARIKELAP